MNCLNSTHFVAYIEGFLNEQAQENIEKHIATCDECRSELETFHKLKERLVKYREAYTTKAHIKQEVMQRIRSKGLAIKKATQAEEQYYEIFQQTADLIGNPNPKIARKGLCDFLKYEYSHRDILYKFLLTVIMRSHYKSWQELKDVILKFGCNIAAYSNKTDHIPEAKACEWLADETTRISEFIATPYRQIYIALVDEENNNIHKKFDAFWLRVNNDMTHIIIVSNKKKGQNRVMAIMEEMRHMIDDKTIIGKGSSDDKDYISFATAQLEVESEEKKLLAKWVVHDLPLKSGAGIIIDAGSSCLEIWKEIVAHTKLRHFSHLFVYTNSYPVLEHWRNNYLNYCVRENKVELCGSDLDADHLAFYPSSFSKSEVRDKVLSEDFEAENVYIGTSGIRFDNKGCVLFGYHAGEKERAQKKLLFECPAERRIIVAAPSKIGFAGGRRINLLGIENLHNAPIYLVTTNPPENNPGIKENYRKAKAMFLSDEMEKAISRHKGLEFHWIIIDRNNGGVPKEIDRFTIPKNAREKIHTFGS